MEQKSKKVVSAFQIKQQLWLSCLLAWKRKKNPNCWTMERKKNWCLKPYLEVGHTKGQESFFEKKIAFCSLFRGNVTILLLKGVEQNTHFLFKLWIFNIFSKWWHSKQMLAIAGHQDYGSARPDKLKWPCPSNSIFMGANSIPGYCNKKAKWNWIVFRSGCGGALCPCQPYI